MTAEEYREELEQKKLSELIGEADLEPLRERQIEACLASYEEAMEAMPDEELFGEAEYAAMCEKAVDELVERFEEAGDED